MIYDRTCVHPWRPGLTTTWKVGAKLYRALDRLDAWIGVASWKEALEWAAEIQPDQKIEEIQFWGHGRWGRAMVDREPLDISALRSNHPLNPLLARIKARMVPKESLWWFRTCETFGKREGHEFARAWSRFFDCKVAGHTYVIWLMQSGLHTLEAGAEPTWPQDEGLHRKERDKARWSSWLEPNTISCFTGTIPPGF